MTYKRTPDQIERVKRGAWNHRLQAIVDHHMQWICPTPSCEAIYNFPVGDPPGNKLLCNGCGLMVTLTPGEMDQRDKQKIEEITKAARNNPDIYDYTEHNAEVRARATVPFPQTDKPVLSRQSWDNLRNKSA